MRNAVALMAFNEKKSRQLAYDDLGYELNRDGGSAVQYWAYRDQPPAKIEELEQLARLLVQHNGLRDVNELRQFLMAGNHASPQALCRELFPPANHNHPQQEEDFADDGVPFIVGPPIYHPRHFFGRQAEVQRIFDAIRGSTLQHVAITGLARSGKTSLLHYINKVLTLPPRALRAGQFGSQVPRGRIQNWAYIDFQDPRTFTREGFFQTLLRQLDLPLDGPVSLPHYADLLADGLKGSLVIQMDEVQWALSNPEFDLSFWAMLRSLASSALEGRLSYIISTHRSLDQLATYSGDHSPFFNIFGHRLELKPFSEDEARELAASSPIPFDPVDVDWMIARSQCWPAPLQALCMERWSALKEGRSGDDWKESALQALNAYQHLLDQARP